jgi:glutamate carboxypeptidase
MPPIPVSYFEERSNDLLHLLRLLVKMESPTYEKERVDAMGRFVARRMRCLGAKVRRFPQQRAGDHWLATWGKEPGGLLLLAHMDTVYPLGTLAKMPWRIAQGQAFGPGVLDMKSGLVIALIAIRALRQTRGLPPWRISLLCTSDEETGSRTSRPLIEELARGHDVVFCLEPSLSDGALKTRRKGIGILRLRTRGVAAHAGTEPQKGVNAIMECTHQIQRLIALQRPEAGTTISVGVIRGGTRTNVIPESCLALLDLRAETREEQERIDAALAALQPFLEGSELSIEMDWNRPPMMRTPSIAQAFHRAKSIAERMGITLSEGGTGGGSDANFVAHLGIPVLDGLGAVGGGAHSAGEYVLLGELPRRAALLAALLSEWQPGYREPPRDQRRNASAPSDAGNQPAS